MNNMIAEFERLGEKEDFQVAIDGMMRQLLSKDLMYEPMKQVSRLGAGAPRRCRRARRSPLVYRCATSTPSGWQTSGSS